MKPTRLRTKAAAVALLPLLIGTEAPSAPPAQKVYDLSGMCSTDAMQAIAPAGVTVKPIRNGMFGGATRFVPAKGNTPAYCQVVGSFVTNPASGKTANFMATFPAAWNGKYLQLGCSSHCGQFYVSNPAMASVTVTAQGYFPQIIEKGYATFATDEGHEGMDGGAWAVKPDGSVDRDMIDDLLYRADKVLAGVGKAFTASLYTRAEGAARPITRSYFQGCSGGGRDAMVAASYFPDTFDGIIAGSPYDMVGVTLQSTAILAAQQRSPDARLTPGLLTLFDKTVKARCDAADGVRDGLVQNPAACNFNPERDLPKCTSGSAPGQCFTPAQVETASVIVSGVTDEHGNVLQPGYSISELKVAPDFMGALSEPALKIFVHGNDPKFKSASLVSFRRGGPGAVSGFHAVIPAVEAARVREALRPGAGHLPENTGRLMSSKTKLLIWHNLSDEALTPYISQRWYHRLAADHGGYERVSNQARLFLLPGTGHCSITSTGPNSFDALGALENWVEHGQAPDALKATVANRQFMPGAPPAVAMSTPNYAMPLCKFPAMARYSGKGDVQDAANWSCRPGDKRMLAVGEAGRQAGLAR